MLLAGIGVFTWVPLRAEALRIELEGGRVCVSAPQFRFLSGKPLERLRNGAPVAFALQLSLSSAGSGAVLARDIERFILSFDLWEEKFSVLKLGQARRTVSNLTSEAAETWCVGQLSLAASGLNPEEPVRVRLEARAEDPRTSAETDEDTAFSLGRLIDLFSRRPREEQRRFSAEAGPLRLADLKKPAGPAGAEIRGRREPAAK